MLGSQGQTGGGEGPLAAGALDGGASENGAAAWFGARAAEAPQEAWAPLAWIGGALLVGYALRWLLEATGRLIAHRRESPLLRALAVRASVPLGWALSFVLLGAVLPRALADPPMDEWAASAAHGVWILGVLAWAWFLMRLLGIGEQAIVSRLGVERADNLRARTLQTQLKVVRQIAVVVLGVLALVAIMQRFDALRQLSTGLLASAGIAGLVLGLAAQRTLSNLIAGLLIGFTQPIRLDDVLIVEGEWGRVEEITLSYVVIAIWDRRRLVVPISYFLDRPFQNWTRTEARILGAVILHLDFRTPIDALRAETERLVKDHPDWDGEVCGVQVTETSERAMQVRVLISAGDSGKAWNLRCFLREKLIAWLGEHHPAALPRLRAELEGGGPADGPDQMRRSGAPLVSR